MSYPPIYMQTKPKLFEHGHYMVSPNVVKPTIFDNKP